MPFSKNVLQFLRSVHLYLGVFLAPALLFFAVTGALQTFSLHETTQGSSYKPPAWIMTLAQLHKKQNTMVSMKAPKPGGDTGKPAGLPKTGAADGKQSAPATAPRPQKSHLPMKLFFLLAACGLVTSTLTGLYMAWRYNRSKVAILGIFAAGIVVPLLLLPF